MGSENETHTELRPAPLPDSTAKEEAEPEKKENPVKTGVEKVTDTVGEAIDRIDDKMDQEVKIAGFKIPFVTLIMSILIIVGAVLPWTVIQNGYETDIGLIVLILAVLVLVFAAIKQPMISGLFGLIGFFLLLYFIIDNDFDIIEYGYWISFVGALLGFIFGFLKK
ncbi:MAG: hypothetical protein AYK23_04975 [Candidatus Proteinoplasmatales archaeon SG8-5]|nr:MAG: hypothetical protein AYK23_04975 [Candidatus Proteinoplasmatales archaeon SG8-5]